MTHRKKSKRTAGKKPDAIALDWPGKAEELAQADVPSDQMLTPAEPDLTQHLFIEGDNLDALKHLLATHSGRVKMIYIDPPYNTGRTFVYDDDFGSSGTWLSMMLPRLVLAHRLLREDGAMFVSIDDGEVHRLRMVLDEIFGDENFVSTIIWEKKYSPQNDALWLSENHDYVLLYAKNKQVWRPNLLPRTDAANARFKNPDNDPRGLWKPADFSVRTYSARCDYPITTPSGRTVNPPVGRCWAMTQARFAELTADNRVWFGKKGNSGPAIKTFLSEVRQGMTAKTIWRRDEVGDTQSARKAMRKLFGTSGVFDTPKPVGLVKRMLQLATSAAEDEHENVVLDFFAGSATTAHGVVEQNAADGGNRRFIMVQLPIPLNVAGFETLVDVGLARVKKVLGTAQSAVGCQHLKIAARECVTDDEEMK